jgi:Zn-dependent peptidase ImmA (M78 family)
MIGSRGWIDPKITRRVDAVLMRSGAPRLSNGVGIDVKRILERFSRLNVRFVADLRLGGRPLLAAYVPQFRCVFVEKHCFLPRQRFSMAHELGHAELEDDFGDADTLFNVAQAFLCTESDTDETPNDERRMGLRRLRERRADKFASLLLMPEQIVRETWRGCGEIRTCADLLGVSMQSLRFRLSELGLLS